MDKSEDNDWDEDASIEDYPKDVQVVPGEATNVWRHWKGPTPPDTSQHRLTK